MRRLERRNFLVTIWLSTGKCVTSFFRSVPESQHT
jgi:hypothetical protein